MPKPTPRLAGTRSFHFEHPQQHGLEDFDRLATQARQEGMAPGTALMLADLMVGQGHPDALRLTGLFKQNPHRDVIAHGIMLEKCFHALRRRLHIETVDRRQLVRAYRKDGYLLFESEAKSRKLLVIFTTIFNNFYLSHLNLYAMLRELGCHLLILKETTLANYQRGVASFASDFPGIADKIQATAHQLGADQIYISGFSSGGYAALQTSLMMPCHGYLGFSHTTDLSPGSSLARPWYITDEIYAQLDPLWLNDLRLLLMKADRSVRRIFCYGDRAKKDVAYAQHLAGLDAMRVVRLRNASHNTIQYLLARGRLTAAFSSLVADR